MAAGAVELADITSADWSLMLDSSSPSQASGSGIGSVVQGIDDVRQCIAIILNTPKGSDPLRPTFGADLWQYIDFPVNAAIPAIVREITDAITLWEPRVKLLAISANLVPNDPSANVNAHLEVNIKWRLNLSAPTPVQSSVLTFRPGVATVPSISGVSA